MVDEIYSGDSFGEEALVQDGYRNATIKMITPAKLWALSKDDFNELIKPGLVDEITSVKAQKEIETNQVVIIDCRYEMEFEESRIPGALHVPLDQIRWDIHELNPKNKYIVYCRSGRRSKAAAFLMQERKFNAVSLAGGIKDWPYQIDDKEILLSDS